MFNRQSRPRNSHLCSVLALLTFISIGLLAGA